jgi:hypothetical protein
MAELTASEVFPTPPFPLDIAIVLTITKLSRFL